MKRVTIATIFIAVMIIGLFAGNNDLVSDGGNLVNPQYGIGGFIPLIAKDIVLSKDSTEYDTIDLTEAWKELKYYTMYNVDDEWYLDSLHASWYIICENDTNTGADSIMLQDLDIMYGYLDYQDDTVYYPDNTYLEIGDSLTVEDSIHLIAITTSQNKGNLLCDFFILKTVVSDSAGGYGHIKFEMGLAIDK